MFLPSTRHINYKHGMTSSSTYRKWQSMKERCLNLSNVSYGSYGGRGIKVCEQWLNSFENFYADMGECPKGLTLDRIDCNGNYTPQNCRWATTETQARNRRMPKNNKSKVRGVAWNKATKRWVAYISVEGKPKTLGYSESLEVATRKRKTAEKKYWGKMVDKLRKAV